MTQWLIGIFVRYLAPKMTYEDWKTMFSLSATSNSLPDCWSCARVGKLKRFGEPFQLLFN